VPAHPFRGWDSLGDSIPAIDGVDALETHNGCSSLDANEKAIHAASALKLPSISGSDRHSVEQVGRACTEFVNPVHTIDDVIEEIKRGNCHGIYT